MRYIIILAVLFTMLMVKRANGQKEDRIWVFGDSIGIDFNNLDSPIVINSAVHYTPHWPENLSVISSKRGQLLFYAFDNVVYNSQHVIMENGYGIFGDILAVQGTIILPFPDNENRYYLFSVTGDALWYSVIDMSYNNGFGRVIQKNILLLKCPHRNYCLSERMQAVKHANGRDWWLFINRYETDDLIRFFIDSTGISDSVTISLGRPLLAQKLLWTGQMVFSPSGDKMGLVGIGGAIAVFTFDRCTGYPQMPIFEFYDMNPFHFGYYGCSFSKNGRFFYVTGFNVTNWINKFIQIDLKNPYPVSNHYALNLHYGNEIVFWTHRLGPDGKIYISAVRVGNRSAQGLHMTHLSVINQPDSKGASCDLRPFSFSTGGRRAGPLPNLPNYRQGPVPSYVLDTPQHVYVICKGVGLQIGISDTFPQIAYHWQTADGQWQSNEMLPYVMPETTTVYYLTRVDTSTLYSCNKRYDTIRVIVQEGDTTYIDTAVVSGTDYYGVEVHYDTTLIYTYKRPGQCDSVVVHDVNILSGIAEDGDKDDGLREFHLYPNPSTGILYLTIDEKVLGMTVYDLMGNQVKNISCIAWQVLSSGCTMIDITPLPEGIYLWEIKVEGGVYRGKVFILLH